MTAEDTWEGKYASVVEVEKEGEGKEEGWEKGLWVYMTEEELAKFPSERMQGN